MVKNFWLQKDFWSKQIFWKQKFRIRDISVPKKSVLRNFESKKFPVKRKF